MVVGVNGVGKTTTIGNWLINSRKQVNPFTWEPLTLSALQLWNS